MYSLNANQALSGEFLHRDDEQVPREKNEATFNDGVSNYRLKLSIAFR